MAILVVAVLVGVTVVTQRIDLLPLRADRTASGVPDAAATVAILDEAFHFEPGAVLSDASVTPSLTVFAKWRQSDAKSVCAESALSQDTSAGHIPVVRLTGSTTQLPIPAVAGREYRTTLKTAVCTPTAKVLATGAHKWRLAQESSANYSYGWVRGQCRCWSGGGISKSSGLGQTATFTANFTSFGLITDHGKNRGTADIYLDGVKVGSINGYSARAHAPMKISFAIYRDVGGPHTVIVKTTSGRVYIDAFLTSGE